jgi:hypothetical protein
MNFAYATSPGRHCWSKQTSNSELPEYIDKEALWLREERLS